MDGVDWRSIRHPIMMRMGYLVEYIRNLPFEHVVSNMYFEFDYYYYYYLLEN